MPSQQEKFFAVAKEQEKEEIKQRKTTATTPPPLPRNPKLVGYIVLGVVGMVLVAFATWVLIYFNSRSQIKKPEDAIKGHWHLTPINSKGLLQSAEVYFDGTKCRMEMRISSETTLHALYEYTLGMTQKKEDGESQIILHAKSDSDPSDKYGILIILEASNSRGQMKIGSAKEHNYDPPDRLEYVDGQTSP